MKNCDFCKHLNVYSYMNCACGLNKKSLEMDEDGSVITPKECPLSNEKKYTWNDVMPSIKWEDIKVGDIYHIPPHDYDLRKDIMITSVFPASIAYKEIGNQYTIYYMYNNDVRFKLMTKKK